MNSVEAKAREKRRLAAIRLLKGKEHSQAEVARLLGVSREAVRKWWAAYESGGRKALKPLNSKTGPKSPISDEQLEELVRKAAELKDADSIAGFVRVARAIGSDISRSALRRRLIDAGLWTG